MDRFKIAVLILFLLTGCGYRDQYKYSHGTLPDTPVNMEEFNSAYDDYNSAPPYFGMFTPFCFSSNRNSQGHDFDVIYKPMSVIFDRNTGALQVASEYHLWCCDPKYMAIIEDGLSKINTTGNEFGPYLHIYNQQSGLPQENSFLLLYATDIGGNLDIHYTLKGDSAHFDPSKAVAFLNSASNDAYPSFTSDFSRIYFCSDRDNAKFDIFYANVNGTKDGIATRLADSTPTNIFKETILSTADGDDKCPYIFNDKLVFTSNRPGGFGGYDLYYSTYKNGDWSAPVNFGSPINSEYDEYRPILFEEEVDFDRNMMIYSSNRTGGKGGFDLYFVGVKK